LLEYFAASAEKLRGLPQRYIEMDKIIKKTWHFLVSLLLSLSLWFLNLQMCNINEFMYGSKEVYTGERGTFSQRAGIVD
jgi:hypothetical protein